MKTTQIPSVNFHLWESCNMRCKFCFASFQDVKQSVLPSGYLPESQAVEIVKQLALSGFRKITFVGGEPMLCPWISILFKTAKNAGMTTMLVTNGSLLSEFFLSINRKHLDWITLSIDSLNPETNIGMGRAIAGKKPLSKEFYKKTIQNIKRFGYGLKINTVVNDINHSENMSDLIMFANPQRWKILQMLPIKGQNDQYIEDMIITKAKFMAFAERHQKMVNDVNIVIEDNDAMKGSYVMIDPAGRFFDNARGMHMYSRPILEVGVKEALKDVNYDFDKFIKREGLYDWEIPKNNFPSRITISGEVASGKTMIGRLLAEKLGYEFTSIGNKIREFAVNKGISIVGFQKSCVQDPELDRKIDAQFANECNREERIVIDYRLGFVFINDSFNIFLSISEEDAIDRISKADRVDETYHTVTERNDAFLNQFMNAYGIDYTASSNYDLVIDVAAFDSAEAIADFIIAHLKCQ